MAALRPRRMEDLGITGDIPPIRYGVTTPRNRTSILPIPSSCADRNRRFVPYPSNATPYDLFTLAPSLVPSKYRFIRRNDRRQMLMFCDGACSDNGGYSPRGGCGVLFEPGGLKFPLLNSGIQHTSNRAELSAIIKGLQYDDWVYEGFENIVIACDSEYVVLGITERLDTWIENGWRATSGSSLANQDLWKELLQLLRHLEKGGCQVCFWQIPRAWNEADKYAKAATTGVSANSNNVHYCGYAEAMGTGYD